MSRSMLARAGDVVFRARRINLAILAALVLTALLVGLWVGEANGADRGRVSWVSQCDPCPGDDQPAPATTTTTREADGPGSGVDAEPATDIIDQPDYTG